MKTVLAAPHLQIGEATLTADGKASHEMFDIDTGGLEPAWTQLFASCPTAPNSARPGIAAPGPIAAPPQ
jgi:hypothetical protein